MENRTGPKSGNSYRWLAGVCLFLAAAVATWLLIVKGDEDFTEIPLAQNTYLNDVIEPITPLEGIIWADGGSLGFLYEDSRHVKRGACLEHDLDFNEKNLSFGGMVPDESTKVPIAGIEEKAFLGLLQRWVLRDPEARELLRRFESLRNSDDKETFREEIEAQKQEAKAFAILLIQRLKNRN